MKGALSLKLEPRKNRLRAGEGGRETAQREASDTESGDLARRKQTPRRQAPPPRRGRACPPASGAGACGPPGGAAISPDPWPARRARRKPARAAPDPHPERGTPGGAGQGSACSGHAGDLYSQAGCLGWLGFPDGK